MIWKDEYYPEAEEDVRKLDGSQQKLIKKAILKIASNPLPTSEGGYGKPLGNKNGLNLTGYLKVKLKRAGLRIVYGLQKQDNIFKIIIIGVRADDEVYEEALKRIEKYKNKVQK